jgi:uncharacterized zinc-type alcohol dehydrogenase-like protein
MSTTVGFGAQSATSPLAQLSFERREPGPTDIAIDILYCGVCHSDLHWVRNEWGMSMFPVVPGHEIVGRVTRVGAGVKGFAAGDMVGVGCLVDSCGTCPECADGLEQYCPGMVLTYGSPDTHLGGITQGGYSTTIVVDQKFVLRVPAGLDPAAAAPLLCAGITTYSPLRHWKVGSGSKLGIVGLGGLGHMGLKFGKALGAHVVLFTTSPGKAADAKRLGADAVVVSNDAEAMKAHAGSFDFILDTVAASHNLDAFTGLLKRDGTLCLVGAPATPHPSPAVFNLLFKRRQIAGSLIGGLRETQEMLDFCGQHGITSDIELVRMQDINAAYERMLKSDVKYRFVIDMASLR